MSIHKNQKFSVQKFFTTLSQQAVLRWCVMQATSGIFQKSEIYKDWYIPNIGKVGVVGESVA